MRPPPCPPSSIPSAPPLAEELPGSPGSRCSEPAAQVLWLAPRRGRREREDHSPWGEEEGGPWPGQAEPSVYLRVRAGAVRCSSRTPPAPDQVAAAWEPPRLCPRRARHSHEHQRCQGVSGPEGNPSAFRGRGLGLAEEREGGEDRGGHLGRSW